MIFLSGDKIETGGDKFILDWYRVSAIVSSSFPESVTLLIKTLKERNRNISNV